MRNGTSYLLCELTPEQPRTGTNDGPLVSPVMGLTLLAVGRKRGYSNHNSLCVAAGLLSGVTDRLTFGPKRAGSASTANRSAVVAERFRFLCVSGNLVERHPATSPKGRVWVHSCRRHSQAFRYIIPASSRRLNDTHTPSRHGKGTHRAERLFWGLSGRLVPC